MTLKKTIIVGRLAVCVLSNSDNEFRNGMMKDDFGLCTLGDRRLPLHKYLPFNFP